MGAKKNAIENLVGLDRYAMISGIPLDTLHDWKNKATADDMVSEIPKLHGSKLYGKFKYEGVQFVFIYGRVFVNVVRSEISEKKRDKYQANFNKSHERHN